MGEDRELLPRSAMWNNATQHKRAKQDASALHMAGERTLLRRPVDEVMLATTRTQDRD